jgi:hypothetical protein
VKGLSRLCNFLHLLLLLLTACNSDTFFVGGGTGMNGCQVTRGASTYCMRLVRAS